MHELEAVGRLSESQTVRVKPRTEGLGQIHWDCPTGFGWVFLWNVVDAAWSKQTF